MENTSLFDEKSRAFTGLELLKLLNKYSGCKWGIEHTPIAMKIYTHSGIYTIKADSSYIEFKGGESCLFQMKKCKNLEKCLKTDTILI